MKNIRQIAIGSVLALLCSPFASSQTVFSVVKIPGSTPNTLIAINNSGQITINGTVNGINQVSIWSRLGGYQALGLPNTNFSGADINSSAEIVGAGFPNNSGNQQAFLWRTGTGIQWLGTLGGSLSAASGVNDSGSVVGFSYTGSNLQHAFLWNQSSGMQDLTPSLTSLGGATATAINASNEVVGYYFPNGSNTTTGFSWTQSGGVQNLGSSGTLAYGVNAAGTIVGQTQLANGSRHAFSYTPSGGIVDLGTLGGSSSSALSVNSKGWITGTSLTTVSGHGLQHGFLWTPAAGMKDFTDLAGLGLNQQAYSVSVNDFGDIAVTTGVAGYLLIPKMTGTMTSSPNPSTLGQPVTVTLTMNSIAGPPPDGEMIKFFLGTKLLGTVPLSGGVAQITTSAVPVGPHVIQAKYAGDANYLAYTFRVTQTVN